MTIILREMGAIHNLLRVFPEPLLPLIAHSGLHLRWRIGWLKGWLYRLKWSLPLPLGGANVVAGARFSIQGRLRVRGPGRVVLSDDVLIDGLTDLYTHSPQARIQIGPCTFLNGTRISAQQEVSIGPLNIVADARIMDTDFHALSRNRQERTAKIQTAPVRTERNVWVSAGAAILKGVTVAENSVIAFGSVVTKDVPTGVIVGGNPAKVISELPPEG